MVLLDLATARSYRERELMIEAIEAAYERETAPQRREEADHRTREHILHPVIWHPPSQPARTTRHVRSGRAKRSKAVIPQVDDDYVY